MLKKARARKMTKELYVDIMCLVWKIILVSGLLCGMFLFLFGFVSIRDRAMFPAIKDGDLVLFYRWNKGYHATDVVVVNQNGEKQVRRVVAVAGDTVDIQEEGLIINGALQQENEIYEETYRYMEGIEFPVTLEEDQIFVLGDAREGSTDSRIYGPIKVSDTCGRVMSVIRHRGI